MRKTFVTIAVCTLALAGYATSGTETPKTKDDALSDIWSISPSVQTVVKAMVESKSKVCGTEYNYEQVMDEIRYNPVYPMIRIINDMSKEVGDILYAHLEQTVDCNENEQWAVNIRDYLKSNEYREIALENTTNQSDSFIESKSKF